MQRSLAPGERRAGLRAVTSQGAGRESWEHDPLFTENMDGGGENVVPSGFARDPRHHLHAIDVSLRRLAVPMREVRQIAASQRRRDVTLRILAVALFALICANIAVVAVAVWIGSDLRHPVGCRINGGYWGADASGREYCVFWTPGGGRE